MSETLTFCSGRPAGRWLRAAVARWAIGVIALAGGAAPAAAQNRPQPALPPGTLAIAALPAGGGGQRPTLAEAPAVLRQTLGLRAADDLRPRRSEADALGFRHTRYQQYYQGIPVEHGTVVLHSRAGRAETWSGAVRLPAATLSTRPALTAAAARQRALAAVGATRYMWQDAAEEAALRQQTGDPRATYFPTGELVVVGDFRQPEAGRPLVLAWKFNVYAAAPVSRAWVYVDAHTGQVVLRDNIIKHINAQGTFATRYSGARTSMADAFSGGYRLRETTRAKGVVTLNMRRGTSYAGAVDFVDNDNDWTAAEYNNANRDNAALDAHLGAQATQDYWTGFHGRDSYDNRGTVLTSYVHYDNGYENAFWNGTVMTYGDGATAFRPLTSVDVCGHEIGHAVCETTAALVYLNEAGAMNEGFSDIWGACVEHHFDPAKQTWLIGEDITIGAPGFLRSMSNPNAADQPDTYLGLKWQSGSADFGGVHTNSGVLNFWFYLLSTGGTGTNDFGVRYNVAGIGIEKAARVAYRAESVYLTSTSVYTDARQATLQAAVDLYGLGTPEVRAVAEAWRAVGLQGGAPALATMTPASGPVGTLVTLTGTGLGTVYQVSINGTPVTVAALSSDGSITVVVPPGATTGPVVLTTTQGTATSAGVFTVTGTGPAPTVLGFAPAGGAPWGTVVTITGTDLTGATDVDFNGVPAIGFIVNSATSITATVPTGATTGPLSVTTPGGTATTPAPFPVLPAIGSLAPTSGPVGTVVTINGTSFSGALDVKFNGRYAAFTVNSATSITATVPSGATTGPVTVRTPTGTATSAPFTVTGSVSVSSFSPASGAVLTSVTIYGTGFTGATALTFNGTPAPGFTVASDNEIWATVPSGATSGPIGVTAPLGTAASADPFVVLIPGAPVITGFSPPAGMAGQSVVINGFGLQGATAVTFNGVAATITAVTPARVTATVPVGATTGRVTVTTPAGVGVSLVDFLVVAPPANDLCSAALPVLACGDVLYANNLGATTSGDPTTGCNAAISGEGVFYRFVGTGDQIRFSACNRYTTFDTQFHVFSGSCGNLTCEATSDDACLVASELTFPTVAGTDYLLFVSGKNHAQGNFWLSVTCLGAPVITGFTPTSGPPGTLVTLTGTNLLGSTAPRFNGRGAPTYTVVSATQLLARVPFAATTGPITVIANGVQFTTAQSFVVVRPTLANISPVSGPVGTVVTITGTGLTDVTSVAFNGAAATSFTVDPSGTQVTAVVPADAAYGPVQVFMGLAMVQTPIPFCPEYLATARDSSRCGPGPVVLRAAGAPATAQRYAWYTTATGNTPIVGATGAAFTTPPLSATTTYYVTVSPAAGCEGPRVPATATIHAAPAPPTISQSPQASGIVLLTSSSPTGNQWLFNGVPISGATQPTYAVTTGAQTGTYAVITTDSSGCASAASAVVQVTVTGQAADAAAAAVWQLWPNPAHHAAQLSGAPARAALAVFDATGRRVRLAQTDAAGAATLDLAGLPRGLYAVRVGAQVRRLVVE